VDEAAAAAHAFLSYASVDSEKADAVQAVLEAAGVRVWRDLAEVWPGDDWRERVRQAIAGDALAFVACLSSAGLAAERSGQHEELLWAVEELRRRPWGLPWLIPVRLDDCEIPAIDIGAGRTLQSLAAADAFGPNRGEGLARLVIAVTGISGRERPGPAGTLPPAGGRGAEHVPRRSPPGSADRAEVMTYLTRLIWWLNADPWPQGTEFRSVRGEAVTADRAGSRSHGVRAECPRPCQLQMHILPGQPGDLGVSGMSRQTARLTVLGDERRLGT